MRKPSQETMFCTDFAILRFADSLFYRTDCQVYVLRVSHITTEGASPND